MIEIPTAILVLLGTIILSPALLFGTTMVKVLKAESKGIRNRPAEAARGEGIVVFGAQVDLDGPSRELRCRLDHSYLLWSRGSAPSILVSGGVTSEIDETEAMRLYLEDKGVPTRAIKELRPGDTTRATIKALASTGMKRLVAVSSPYHCHRIRAEAKRRSLELVPDCPAHTPETNRKAMHRAQRITEVVASWWYALPERFTAQVDTGPDSLRHRIPFILAGKAHPIPETQQLDSLQPLGSSVEGSKQ